MQDLSGEATPHGLWLESEAECDRATTPRFRVRSVVLGRPGGGAAPLADQGLVVCLSEQTTAWLRPGLTEEYRTGTDGVRQDFVLSSRPMGDGDHVTVELEVMGARAEAADYGVKLTMDVSGREIAFHRLHVTDATGRELAARMDVPAPDRVRLDVVDSGAVYPVRIDPTFSDADWVALGGGLPGASGVVNALLTTGPGVVFAGGDFKVVGSVVANGIARWNGSGWSALGSGMERPENGYAAVRALAVVGDDIYAGGEFSRAGGVAASNVARWDGSGWSALGEGTNDTVHALAVIGGALYAGGSFTSAGGIPAEGIAKWDGSEWSSLGGGLSSRNYVDVLALLAIGSDLYVGGYFEKAGGSPAKNIAKWNGSAWDGLGPGLEDPAFEFSSVSALAGDDTAIFAGGDFTVAGATSVNYVAEWDGASWSALGAGVSSVIGSGAVYALAMADGNLYAGGGNVAKWNGSEWSALASGVENRGPGFPVVYALASAGGTVYAGGTFDTAGGVWAHNLAKWDDGAWSTLGSGTDGYVLALATVGSDLYAGGAFDSVGGVPARNIVRWDGNTWRALGAGVDGWVTALAASGGSLYVGGRFSQAGTLPASRVAKWDGGAWSALGAGVSGGRATVSALASVGANLYVGGSFSEAGGVAARGVAKWNGSAWSPLGGGLEGEEGDDGVLALAVSGSDLYAGGEFQAAGGTVAYNIAKWNGAAWSAVGGGTDGTVRALVVAGGSVFAGGDFRSVEGVSTPASRIARWDGTKWSTLGVGVEWEVWALAAHGSDIYAGGGFLSAGGAPANRVAKWDGSVWSPLGSGVDGWVYALATDDARLYLGGEFASVGQKVSPAVAGADLDGGSPRLPDPRVRLVRVGGEDFLEMNVSPGFTIEGSPNLAPGSWAVLPEASIRRLSAELIQVKLPLPPFFIRVVAP